MEKSGFFNSVNGDRRYKVEDFAEYFKSFITNGVFPNPSTNLQVTANNNMTVTLKSGKAWINGYIYVNTDDLILSIDPADGALNRIDRIVLRYDTVNREIRAKVKKGTFASSPTATTLQRDADGFELGIADVYISKGVINIVQANITDLRMNIDLCGWVNSLIQADTTAIFNQYLDWYQRTTGKYEQDINNTKTQFEQDFNTWLNGIKVALDGDTAGNLLNMINALGGTGRTTETIKGNADEISKVKSSFEAYKTENSQSIGNINDDTLPVELKGKSLTEMAKVNFQSGINAKQKVVAALNANGASVTTSNTWDEVAGAVPTIAGYKKGDELRQGSIYSGANNMKIKYAERAYFNLRTNFTSLCEIRVTERSAFLYGYDSTNKNELKKLNLKGELIAAHQFSGMIISVVETLDNCINVYYNNGIAKINPLTDVIIYDKVLTGNLAYNSAFQSSIFEDIDGNFIHVLRHGSDSPVNPYSIAKYNSNFELIWSKDKWTYRYPLGLTCNKSGNIYIIACDTYYSGASKDILKLDTNGNQIISVRFYSYNTGYSTESILVSACYDQLNDKIWCAHYDTGSQERGSVYDSNLSKVKSIQYPVDTMLPVDRFIFCGDYVVGIKRYPSNRAFQLLNRTTYAVTKPYVPIKEYNDTSDSSLYWAYLDENGDMLYSKYNSNGSLAIHKQILAPVYEIV